MKSGDAMKVLLVNPPSHGEEKFVREGRCMQRAGAWTAIWAPISLATIAAVLRDDGANVRLYDCVVEEVTREGLAEAAARFRPDLLVLNSSTPSIEDDLACAELVAARVPDVIACAFGIHVSALPVESLQSGKRLDAVAIGEPEGILRDLVREIRGVEGREARLAALARVPGLAWKRGQAIRRNAPAEPIRDLAELPFPAWDLVDVSRYTMPFTGAPFLLVATGRGCPHGCTFCAAHAYYGRRLRLRPATRVVDEIEWCRDRFGVEDFLIWTEAFTMDNAYALSVCEEILRRGLRIRFVCNSRVDHVAAPLLARMKEAGCVMIGYGIESGNQETLDRCKKGVTLDQIRNAVRLTREAGIEVTGHMMVGFPGEGREEIARTVAFAKELDLDFVQFYAVVPFPGSRLFEEARREGRITTWDFRQFEQNFGVLHTGRLDPAEVTRLRSEAYRSFYFRPRTVLKTLRKIDSFAKAKRFAAMVRDFLTWI